MMSDKTRRAELANCSTCSDSKPTKTFAERRQMRKKLRSMMATYQNVARIIVNNDQDKLQRFDALCGTIFDLSTFYLDDPHLADCKQQQRRLASNDTGIGDVLSR